MSGGLPAFSRTLSWASNSLDPSKVTFAPVQSSNAFSVAWYISVSGLWMEA